MSARDLSGELLVRLDWLGLDAGRAADFRRLVQQAANRLRAARQRRNPDAVREAFDDAARLLDAWGVELFPTTRKIRS